MNRSHHKNTITNNQNNVVPPEASSPTMVWSVYSNTAVIQENSLKSNLMKIIGTFKWKINKSLTEIQENTMKQVKKIKKTIQGLKREAIKKTQTEGILEIESLGK